MSKKPKFHCKSEAQKRAIRRSYAEREKNVGKIKSTDKDIPVRMKDHMDKNGGHPHVIMDNIDDCHVSVGLSTRDKKGRNHPNYKMEKSPLNDGKQSYMRRQAIVAPKSEYEKPRQGSMTKKDHEYAKSLSERAKQKYIAENDKKNGKKK